MKKYIFTSFIFAIVSISALSQNYGYRDQSAKHRSDSLYAIGVALYNASRFKEAIPYFTECDHIDKAQLPENSNRRLYAAMWLANCCANIGDTLTAESIYPNYQFYKPIDRRLTVVSDSLSELSINLQNEGKYEDAVKCLERSALIEKIVIGDNNICWRNTYLNCG